MLYPTSTVSFEKLTVAQSVKKLPTLYQIQWFLAMFTKSHQNSSK